MATPASSLVDYSHTQTDRQQRNWSQVLCGRGSWPLHTPPGRHFFCTKENEFVLIDVTGGNDQKVGGNDQKVGGNDQKVGENDQKVGGNDQKVGDKDQKVGRKDQKVGDKES